MATVVTIKFIHVQHVAFGAKVANQQSYLESDFKTQVLVQINFDAGDKLSSNVWD